jgi:hypothetical protein
LRFFRIIFLILINISFFRSRLSCCSCRSGLSTIYPLNLLLVSITLCFLITFTNVISGIHLKQVEPAIPLFVFEVTWANVYYTLIAHIWSSIASSIHIFCHILLMLFHLMFFSNFTCRYSTFYLACQASPWVLMIIAHCRDFILLTSSEIPFNDIFAKVFFELLLSLIHKPPSFFINFLKKHLNTPLFLPINLLSDSFTFFFVCC